MAYSDYGAFVFKNGERQEQFEDCAYNGHLAHGLINDGTMAIICYKQGLPKLLKNGEEIEYYDHEKLDIYWFEPFDYELDGYKFHFENEQRPYVVTMITPNGDVWECQYDYWYGAGFEEEY